MSDTVDNVMDVVNDSEPAEDVVVSEETEPVEEAPAEEVAESDSVVEEVAGPEPEPEPAPSAPVSTQEVVQNVQEILSSTETNVSGNDLENRVKVLEERLEKMTGLLKNRMPAKIIDNYLL